MHRIVVQRSFQMSADVAHAIHPNYANKHEAKHQPLLNKGTVIKTNDNQRYATNSVTGFVVRELGRMASVPIQEFVVSLQVILHATARAPAHTSHTHTHTHTYTHTHIHCTCTR